MTADSGVVVLTGTDVQHRFVASALAESGKVTAVVVDHGLPATALQRLRSGRRRFGGRGLVKRTALRAVLTATGESRRRDRGVYKVLGGNTWPDGVPVFEIEGVNRPETVRLLEELQPDVLCIYGTSIVREPVLRTAGVIALNLHTGISPLYRGADCAFWPLYRREPQWLGATVHECTSAVDGGAIFGTVRATPARDDGVGAVFARCVAAGAELYTSVLTDILQGTAEPVAQDLSTGTEFRAAMRDWRAELAVWRSLRAGLLRPVANGEGPTLPPEVLPEVSE